MSALRGTSFPASSLSRVAQPAGVQTGLSRHCYLKGVWEVGADSHNNPVKWSLRYRRGGGGEGRCLQLGRGENIYLARGYEISLPQGPTSDLRERETQSLMCPRINYAKTNTEREARTPLHPHTLTDTGTRTHKPHQQLLVR